MNSDVYYYKSTFKSYLYKDLIMEISSEQLVNKENKKVLGIPYMTTPASNHKTTSVFDGATRRQVEISKADNTQKYDEEDIDIEKAMSESVFPTIFNGDSFSLTQHL